MTDNRLKAETSPYLQQHADNPVDWFPWGSEALEKARTEDKPILLSIGYSACHWCHVMAHESFEDAATAAVMNRLYVNIKVDREERPDIDKIYQLAHQLMARRGGGWPLTVFLNPQNLLPIFAGTYFPNTPRYQMPAFTSVLEGVANHYRTQKSDVEAYNRSFAETLAAIGENGAAEAPDGGVLEQARSELQGEFDAVNGGFGSAPKFPHTAGLEFLLNRWWLSGRQDEAALAMARYSLEKMAEGGLYDQVGGGFCRYSVDAAWQIPHFEKMLYDNGPLLALTAELFRATGNPLFRHVAEDTAGWVIREMQSEEGGFFSSLDADSEGEEGKYYVWSCHDIKALLSDEDYAVVEPHFGLDQAPNFEGHWHLRIAQPLPEVAGNLGISLEEAECRLLSARAMLHSARERRVRPGLDDKVLTAWNGLMIKGMAVAGRLLERADFVHAAEQAFDFLLAECCSPDGRLLATYKDGRAHLDAYLDDYAYFIDAGLELLQCRWRSDDLNRLIQFAEQLLTRFEDPEAGGFFFTANDHEALIHRPKTFADESMPAGNGIAASALLRLGHLLGDTRYIDAAERALKAAANALQRYPSGHGAVLLALTDALHPVDLVIVRADEDVLPEWLAAARNEAAADPRRLVFGIPAQVSSLPGLLAERKAEPEPVAYVCSGTTCSPPIRDLAALRAV